MPGTATPSLPPTPAVSAVTAPADAVPQDVLDTGPVFGVSVQDRSPAAIDRIAEQVGHRPRWVQVFASVSAGISTTALRSTPGLTPVLTVEPWRPGGRTHQDDFRLADTLSGRWDGQYWRIAQAVAAYQKPMLIRYAHEMNGAWYPWGNIDGNTPSQYIKAWRHVVRLFNQAGAVNALWVWAPNVPSGTDGTPLRAYYPGDDWVDFVGLTGYAMRGSSPSATYGPALRQIYALTKKSVILAETGARPGADKLLWIRAFGPWLRDHPRVVAFVWTQRAEGLQANADWRFDDTAADLAAFRKSLKIAGVSR